MSRLGHAANAADVRVDASGSQVFRAKTLPRFLLRDGSRVLRAGSFESVTCIAASRVPDGAEVVSEGRESVRAIFVSRLEAFVVNT